MLVDEWSIMIGRISSGDDVLSPKPEPEGTITTAGTFLANGAEEYIICEYTEYFSAKIGNII